MRHNRFFRLGVCLTAVVLFAPLSIARDDKAHSWTYSGEHGPEHWGELDASFAACKTGQQQSPIDIRSAKSLDLPAIEFKYQGTPLRIINNGHTIEVYPAPGSAIAVGGERYELKRFHFHHPSEEKINGKEYAMVVHLVHADAKGKSAVVGVLLEEGRANPLIGTVWSYLPAEAGPERKYEDVRINVADLLPDDHGYYTYPGSLTTPPCSEGVRWFVLKKPVTISKGQAEAFGKIYAHNARPTQPLHGRTVLETK